MPGVKERLKREIERRARAAAEAAGVVPDEGVETAVSATNASTTVATATTVTYTNSTNTDTDTTSTSRANTINTESPLLLTPTALPNLSIEVTESMRAL